MENSVDFSAYSKAAEKPFGKYQLHYKVVLQVMQTDQHI